MSQWGSWALIRHLRISPGTSVFHLESIVIGNSFKMWESYDTFYLLVCLNILYAFMSQSGSWVMADLPAGLDQLSKQMSLNPWMGWSLQQSEGTHQQCCSHETVTILQGLFNLSTNGWGGGELGGGRDCCELANYGVSIIMEISLLLSWEFK